MGCGSSSHNDNDDVEKMGSVNELQWILKQHESRPLKKQLEHCSQMSKMAQQNNMAAIVLSTWDQYVSSATESSNIFSGVLKHDPDVVSFFADTKHYNRHTALVHKMLRNCLHHVVNGNVVDLCLALNRLGCMHGQKCVPIKHLNVLEETSTSLFHRSSVHQKEHAKLLARRPSTNYNNAVNNAAAAQNVGLAQETIKEVIGLVVELMAMGVQKHENVMAYVTLMVGKKDDCWSRKRMAKKCQMHMAWQSWNKLSLHLSRL